eukprot:3941325-Rhodomonas_salina.1
MFQLLPEAMDEVAEVHGYSPGLNSVASRSDPDGIVEEHQVCFCRAYLTAIARDAVAQGCQVVFLTFPVARHHISKMRAGEYKSRAHRAQVTGQHTAHAHTATLITSTQSASHGTAHSTQSTRSASHGTAHSTQSASHGTAHSTRTHCYTHCAHAS